MNSARLTDFMREPDVQRTQFGAICWRMQRGRVQVLLITSRDTGRWVIPKGWPIDGLAPHAAAAREAWEEAGVTGDAAPEPLGSYGYDKGITPSVLLPCSVMVFGLRAQKLASRFPERKERRRKWFDARDAATQVAEPELRAMLHGLARARNGALKVKSAADVKQAADVAT